MTASQKSSWESARRFRAARWVAASLALHVPFAPLSDVWDWLREAAPAAGGLSASMAPIVPLAQYAEALSIEEEEQRVEPEPADATTNGEAARPRPRKRRAKVETSASPAPERTPRPTQSVGAGAAAGDASAGVRLVLHLAAARAADSAPASALMSAALGASEWRGFVDAAELVASTELDRVLLAGASLRGAADALAIFEVSSGQRLKGALDAAVQKAGGEWMTAALPLAQAHLGGEQRIFALPTANRLVAARATERARVEHFGASSAIAAPARSELASLYLGAPARALSGIVEVPRELRRARVLLTVTEASELKLDASMLDENPQRAAAHARLLERALQQVSGRALGAVGKLAAARPFANAHFAAKNADVFGEVRLDPQQVSDLTELLQNVR